MRTGVEHRQNSLRRNQTPVVLRGTNNNYRQEHAVPGSFFDGSQFVITVNFSVCELVLCETNRALATKYTRGRMCLKKTHARVFFDSLFSVRIAAKRYIVGIQQKCLKK